MFSNSDFFLYSLSPATAGSPTGHRFHCIRGRRSAPLRRREPHPLPRPRPFKPPNSSGEHLMVFYFDLFYYHFSNVPTFIISDQSGRCNRIYYRHLPCSKDESIGKRWVRDSPSRAYLGAERCPEGARTCAGVAEGSGLLDGGPAGHHHRLRVGRSVVARTVSTHGNVWLRWAVCIHPPPQTNEVPAHLFCTDWQRHPPPPPLKAKQPTGPSTGGLTGPSFIMFFEPFVRHLEPSVRAPWEFICIVKGCTHPWNRFSEPWP